MVNIYAVITGDLVDSTKLSVHQKEETLQLLSSFPSIASSVCPCQIEMFRGDSFQIKIDNAEQSLRMAILLRALLRAVRFDNRRRLDARLALGIGSVDFITDSLLTSDGEAFRLSGRTLDDIGKARLKISTFDKNFNKEFMVSTAFADNIISGWTHQQSKAVELMLTNNINHTELAERMGVSRQMASKYLSGARFNLIELYLNRFITLSKTLI